MKPRMAVAACAITAALVLLSARGEAPVKIAEWISIEDLHALAAEQIQTLGQQLAAEEGFATRNEKDIPRTAGALACVAQAIAEHKDKGRLKVAALPLRDAALQIASADSFAAAAAALKQAQAAFAGEGPAGGTLEADWTELIGVVGLMDEVNERNAKLVQLKRRIRRPESESLHAVMAALMSLPIHDLAESYVGEEDYPKWRQYSLDYGRAMKDAAAAIRQKDTKLLATLVDRGNQACDACHKDFRGDVVE